MDEFLGLGPSPSIILYFQTREGSSAKKNLEVLVFLYYNSFISYEYLVSLNFDASLCRFRHSCFDIRLVFLIISLSHMPLSDFLCASLDQCNIPGLRERKQILRLVNLICKIWKFLRQNVANFSFFLIFFLQNLAKSGI